MKTVFADFKANFLVSQVRFYSKTLFAQGIYNRLSVSVLAVGNIQYHGLYRSVRLVFKDSLHITDPVLAERPASGGVLVTYPEATPERATVRAQVHVRNDGLEAREFTVRLHPR